MPRDRSSCLSKATSRRSGDRISLRELQVGFSRHLFHDGLTDFAAQLKDKGLSGERRLQVYRNNTYLSFTAALQASYPVIQRLVGEGFFRYAAHQYITSYPASSGDLHDYGATFPNFLSGFEPVVALDYLADVARLEWAYERVYYSADHPGLDLSALAKVPEKRYGRLKFALHPASCLLSSPYPILRIWQVNQSDYEGDQAVNLEQGGDWLLLHRNRHLEVEIQRLAKGEFTLLQSLANGHRFATACELALQAQPDLELPACLQHHVGQGTLVDFFFANSSSTPEDSDHA